MLGTFKIAVLGSPGVGKTSIIRRFLYNEFSEGYSPSKGGCVYRSSVVLNDNLFDLKMMDVPYIPEFPANRTQEWSDARCRGVRSANAYVLVYDICCLDSFEYVKMIRQQITDLRTSNNAHKVPIVVVGNKRDLQKPRFARRRSLCVLVKKVWRCGYIECSAKCNWHVLLLFKELLSSAVERGYKHSHASIRIQGALQGNRCSVM